MKRIMLALAVVLLASNAAAYGDYLIVNSPEENQVLESGEDIILNVEAVDGYKMGFIGVLINCPETDGDFWHTLGQTFFTGDYKKSYQTSFDATGKGPGQCTIKIASKLYEDGTENYKFNYGFRSIFLSPDLEANTTVKVVRNMSDTFYPTGQSNIYIFLSVYPAQEFTGIIVKETIPEGLKLLEQTLPPAGFGEGSSADWTYNEETRELKFVIMSSDYIPYKNLRYILSSPPADVVEPGTEYEFSGSWTTTEFSGNTEGKNIIKAAGFAMPQCPITDEQLLEYIDEWANSELSIDEDENDQIILEILEVWKNC